jgi:ATP-dependent DNA helicase PIF1
MQDEDRSEGITEVPSINSTLNHGTSTSVDRDIGLVPHEVEFSNETMSQSDWFELLTSLNTLQSEVHDFIVQWCTNMLISHKTRRPDPFHLFLTDGAGVGKSHLVRVVVQTVNSLFCRCNQSQDLHVLVCAPTGAAAHNISGYTLHAAFFLPVNVRNGDDYVPLSGERLAALKETIGNVQVFIIDDISMVGSDMLLTVHCRLCDVMGNDQLFGGVSILTVSDLLQMPPVA